MEQTGTVKLAKALKILVTITFLCNLVVLPLVPGLVGIGAEGGMGALRQTLEGFGVPAPLMFLVVCWQYFWRFWQEQYICVLTVFLVVCGSCTAVILWQARGVLGTIINENTFTMPNAKRMKRAAVCCLLISAAACCRMLWGFTFYQSLRPLFTYNALFVPVFLMGGLLCMVMSALFRQAAELKEENDLTI